MRPRIGSYVYVISYVNGEPYCITKDKVYMKNLFSFITEDMLNDAVIDEYKKPLSFEDVDGDWAKTLKEAKEIVKKAVENDNEYRETKYKPIFNKDDNYNWKVEFELL